jgi:hypothetical protein
MVVPAPYTYDEWRNDDFTDIADSAQLSIRSLVSTVQSIREISPGSYTFFYHSAQIEKRIGDIERVLKRMAKLRRSLFELDAEFETLRRKLNDSEPYSDHMIALDKERMNLATTLEMDFESLYFFGSILLDQLAAIASHVGGRRKMVWFSRFVKLFENESEDPAFPSELSLVWQRHRRELLQHYASFRVFRDKFIVHSDLPWRRGHRRDLIRGEFFLLSDLSLDWLTDDELNQALEDVTDLGKFAPLWLKPHLENLTPLEQVSIYFHNIDAFQSAERERIQKAILRFGFDSDSYHDVATNLLELTANFLTTLMDIAKASPDICLLNVVPKTLSPESTVTRQIRRSQLINSKTCQKLHQKPMPVDNVETDET